MEIGAVVFIGASISACAGPAPISQLDEYEDRAEAIHNEILGLLPASGGPAVIQESAAQYGESQLFAGPERDDAFWTTWSMVRVSDESTPAEAAQVVGASLAAQEWNADPLVDDAGNPRNVSVYRLPTTEGEWIAQIGWGFIDDDRLVSLEVQSPLTVRGE